MTLTPFYIFLIWAVIAIIFVIAEIVTFGFIVIFFAFGALVAGICAWAFDILLVWQLVIFAVASIAMLVVLRKICIKTFRGKESKDVDDDYHKVILGQTVEVTKNIIPPAQGEVKYSGSFWKAVADCEIPAGAVAEIIARENDETLVFKVKPKF